MHKIVYTCVEAARLISESLDHLLPLGTRLRLRVHLLLCGACTRYRQQLQSIREALWRHADRVTGQQLPTGLAPEARERLMQVLRQKQRP